MLNIRLSRVGKKWHAQYKIVVAEKSSPVKGKFVEQLGSYDPHTKSVIAKKERVEYWIGNGAACSDTVKNLFIENKIIEGTKVKLTFKTKKDTTENTEEGESKNVKADSEKKDSEKLENGSDKQEESVDKNKADKKE